MQNDENRARKITRQLVKQLADCLQPVRRSADRNYVQTTSVWLSGCPAAICYLNI